MELIKYLNIYIPGIISRLTELNIMDLSDNKYCRTAFTRSHLQK
jgi:hypothetical protein